MAQNVISKNNNHIIQKTPQENQYIQEFKKKDFKKEELTSYLKEIEKVINGLE